MCYLIKIVFLNFFTVDELEGKVVCGVGGYFVVQLCSDEYCGSVAALSASSADAYSANASSIFASETPNNDATTMPTFNQFPNAVPSHVSMLRLVGRIDKIASIYVHKSSRVSTLESLLPCNRWWTK
jgi:hypothetical protein